MQLAALRAAQYSAAYSQRPADADTWTEIAHLFDPSRALRGLLASAAAFVPELEPLVRKAVESPLAVPIDEDNGESRAEEQIIH